MPKQQQQLQQQGQQQQQQGQRMETSENESIRKQFYCIFLARKCDLKFLETFTQNMVF